jgi:hypothetical protein
MVMANLHESGVNINNVYAAVLSDRVRHAAFASRSVSWRDEICPLNRKLRTVAVTIRHEN